VQGEAADTLHTVSAKAAYEDTVRALKGCHDHHKLAMAYCSQLKARIQLNGMPLQKFAMAVEQLAHQDLVRLPEHLIQRQAIHAFVSQ
jgi:hypothetical protein